MDCYFWLLIIEKCVRRKIVSYFWHFSRPSRNARGVRRKKWSSVIKDFENYEMLRILFSRFQAAGRNIYIYMPIFDNLVRDIFRGSENIPRCALGIPLFLMVRLEAACKLYPSIIIRVAHKISKITATSFASFGDEMGGKKRGKVGFAVFQSRAGK